jgi:drug/metabolite transporter (DMT)-like permease
MSTQAAAPAQRAEPLAVAAGVTLVLWASGFVGIRAAADDFAPGSLALLRVMVAAVVLGVMVAARREPFPPLRALPPVVVCGVLWFAGYSFLLNAGERQVDAGTAAMLVSLGPILIALLAGAMLGEGFPRSLFLGCAIAFGGVALIGFAGSGDGRSGGWGTLLCLAAALCYAGAVIAQKIALRSVGLFQVNFVCAVVATLVLLPAAPSLERDLGEAPASSIAWVVYLGAFPMALAFTTWAYALARTSAGGLASTTYLVPAISILLGWAVLGETPAGLAFVGGAVCIAGVAVARRRPVARAG